MNALPDLTLEQFEGLAFDVESFDHEAHVYAAWLCLHEYSQAQAIDVYSRTLQNLTRSLGVPQKYHATITWFYLLMIAERIQAMPDADWVAFRDDNSDLFGGPDNVLYRYYDKERLFSEASRNQFQLPRPNRPEGSDNIHRS